jgi:hypothetical protein
VAGARFSVEEMQTIDVAYRVKGLARCPLDEKPLLTTTWPDRRMKMVYFVCRACSRIGAVGYQSADPNVPGLVATGPRYSSRPPPQR